MYQSPSVIELDRQVARHQRNERRWLAVLAVELVGLMLLLPGSCLPLSAEMLEVAADKLIPQSDMNGANWPGDWEAVAGVDWRVW